MNRIHLNKKPLVLLLDILSEMAYFPSYLSNQFNQGRLALFFKASLIQTANMNFWCSRKPDGHWVYSHFYRWKILA